ncbi:MAG: FCD domain-containing protein [Devosia sp.]|uniref:FCD domain-containing protein n=1 Tax=Devosia sp. TaxID=1871048 RepID=UPI001A567C84|nr:FCD domain-containing protein [Devosia sp.]MBL8598943.1 FCD domain-containing protein [Devosia sp.]
MTIEEAQPAGHRKKFQEISEHLELMIFLGKLQPGDKISSERDLMAQFEAGRSSVREALFSLQRKGLLAIRPGAAARVTSPSANTMVSELSGAARHLLRRPEGMRGLQEARALFEIGLSRRAAMRATREDLEQLAAALEQNRLADDQEEFIRTDMQFHYTLSMITHNDIFTSLNMALNEWLVDQRRVSARSKMTFAEAYEEHKAIYDAIAARDPIAAMVAMERHLDSVVERYWQHISG